MNKNLRKKLQNIKEKSIEKQNSLKQLKSNKMGSYEDFKKNSATNNMSLKECIQQRMYQNNQKKRKLKQIDQKYRKSYQSQTQNSSEYVINTILTAEDDEDSFTQKNNQNQYQSRNNKYNNQITKNRQKDQIRHNTQRDQSRNNRQYNQNRYNTQQDSFVSRECSPKVNRFSQFNFYYEPGSKVQNIQPTNIKHNKGLNRYFHLTYSIDNFKAYKQQQQQQQQQNSNNHQPPPTNDLECMTSEQIITILQLKQNDYQVTTNTPASLQTYDLRLLHNVDISNFQVGPIIAAGQHSVVNTCTLKAHSTLPLILKTYKKYDIKMNKLDINKRLRTSLLAFHKNIIRTWFTFQDKYHIYTIHDLGHQTLQQYTNQPLQEHLAKHIFYQILQAIVYLHTNHIAHLDIQLKNIYVQQGQQPHVKITGFQNCQVITQDKKINVFRNEINQFMCPDQVNKKFYDAKKSDVWSLGVILFYLINGYLPFGKKNSNPKQLIIQINIAQYQSKVQISENLQNLFFKIFQLQQDKRISAKDILKHKWLQNL